MSSVLLSHAKVLQQLPPLPPTLPLPLHDQAVTSSRNLPIDNLDVPSKPPWLPCSCGRLLSLSQDWYAKAWDGTLRCFVCAQCCNCGVGSNASKKIVSLEGLLFCYECAKMYGHWEQQLSFNLYGLRRIRNDDTTSSSTAARTSRTEFRIIVPKRKWVHVHVPVADDGARVSAAAISAVPAPSQKEKVRRFKRYIRMGSRVRQQPASEKISGSGAKQDPPPPPPPDPKSSAAGCRLQRMSCPACQKVATGSAACVAPALARVYHRACFCCFTCAEPLSPGPNNAGVQYMFCTCDPPVLWCARYECSEKRLQHHEEHLCCLGTIQPGGRDIYMYMNYYKPMLSAQKIPQAPCTCTQAAADSSESSTEASTCPAAICQGQSSAWKKQPTKAVAAAAESGVAANQPEKFASQAGGQITAATSSKGNAEASTTEAKRDSRKGQKKKTLRFESDAGKQRQNEEQQRRQNREPAKNSKPLRQLRRDDKKEAKREKLRKKMLE